VACEHREVYQVYCEHGDISARVSGRFRHRADLRSDFPAVGDWVAMAVRPGEGQATIQAVLPRKSCFRRKVATAKTDDQVVAANVDTVLLVSSLDREFNLRRIERYLTLAWESGAVPVVVLNKADLCADAKGRVAEAEGIAMGALVHAVSALRPETLGAVYDLIRPGTTVGLMGSSGVGKSTLINALVGRELIETGEVRQSDGRGRHITTHRELIPLPGGGMVIDTPGMREIQLWAEEGSLQDSFGDIEELAAGCRFSDCNHRAEPGCAVREALEDGRLEAGRFKSYQKLQRELRYLAARKEQRARFKEKTWGKQIAKWSRQRRKMGLKE
jgi:ribosome biogenesis GTPase